jgi:hypothetical protein
VFTNRANGDVVGEIAFDAASYLIGLTIAQTPPPVAVAAGTLEFLGGERLWVVVAGNGEEIGTEETNALRYRVVDTSAHPAPWTVSDVPLTAP